MSRTVLGGVSLALVTGLIVGLASGWQSRSAERELRATQVQLQAAQLRLAREVELLRDALAAQGALPNPAVFSVEAARVPDPAPAGADRREREGGRESRPTPDELLAAFPSLVGEAKADALRDLVELARNQDARARDLIVASLADADAEVREEAVDAIGELADPTLIGALSGLTTDVSDRVREEVAEALARMPAEHAGPVLTGMLTDASSDVAEEAIEAIGELGYRGAFPQLVDLVRRSDNLELIAEAGSTLRSLGESGAVDEAVARIAGALESKDAVDRLAAVRHLGTIGGDQSVAWLRSVVEKDSSSSVRAEAREALARLTRD